MDKEESEAVRSVMFTSIFMLPFIVMIILASCAGSRVYDVWAQGKEGEAELAKAESNRQIKTLEAKAHEESAKYLSNAEIIRAEGVAKANKIIGDSLRDNESYLRYLWVQGLNTNQTQVIYVPAECQLPIMEATRLK